MSEHSVTAPLRASSRMVVVVTAGSYAVLGSILLITRLVGLNRSYWHDEIVTVADFVRGGPREILAGPYLPNNHELFSLLAWATSSLLGESEITMRLWSVLPFIVGVAVVTSWRGFYLERPVKARWKPAVARSVCRSPQAVVLVYQPWVFKPIQIPCEPRAGVKHYRLEQYTRGDEINVWFIPPAP